MTAHPSEPITKEQLEQFATGFGEYLARILHASTLTQEQKDAWAVLVPEMTIEQMSRFAAVMEKYVDAEQFSAVVQLRQELETIHKQYEAKMAALTTKAQSDLAAVMAEVKAAESAR